MKFCLITTFFPPHHFGGDAIVVGHQANLLAAAGHEVDVVYSPESFRLLGGATENTGFPIDPRVRLHPISSTWGFLGPLSAHQTGRARFLGRDLRDFLSQPFDVVHWHNLSLMGGPAALELARGVRLCTLHDYWFLCPTSILFRYDGSVCEQKDCLRCSIAHRRPPQLWRHTDLLSEACRHVDCFIAPSQFVREKYLRSELAISADVLPHFVPPVGREPKSAGGYYLFTGRLENYKGVQNLFQHFDRRGRELWIAGTGSYEQELRRLAGANPNVRFLGRVEHSQLPRLYAGARATLIPSICWETFGMTAIESLQQATPVLANDFGALPEVIEETGGGMVVRSQQELAATLDAFDADPSQAAAIGQRGFSRLERYSPQRFLEGYMQLIERTLAFTAGDRK